uniref:Putative secreted protein n=1 Tax=Anopheles triannulatus TaxID=58253 RepID=A0A2M4B6I9_9DIPT
MYFFNAILFVPFFTCRFCECSKEARSKLRLCVCVQCLAVSYPPRCDPGDHRCAKVSKGFSLISLTVHPCVPLSRGLLSFCFY